MIERVPFEAQNALRGETSAFDAMGKSAVQLKTLRGASTPKLAADPAWNKITDAVSQVAAARAAVGTIQSANQEARDLAPSLLSDLGDLASAVGGQKLEGMTRHLERFELTVQRVLQDLSGLGSGVTDAAPTAQRLADNLEFLDQVIRGLSGEEQGSAARVTGAEPEQRLHTLVLRNQQFAAAVRKAIGAALPLSKAQGAARMLPALTSALAAKIGAIPAAEGDAGATYKPAI